MNLPKLLTQNQAYVTEIIGSSFLGTIKITHKELTNLLGRPHFEGSVDDKVGVEWAYLISRGNKKTVVTIYDYKYDGDPAELTTWHIGGKGDQELIKDWVKTVFQRPMSK